MLVELSYLLLADLSHDIHMSHLIPHSQTSACLEICGERERQVWGLTVENIWQSEDTTEADKRETALKLCSVEGLAFDSTNKSLVHLCDAAASGNSWHIALLLHAQAFEVDDADSGGYTALMAAAEFGHVECLQTLLAAKAQVDMQNVEKDMITALFLAAKEGHINCLTPLYARGKRENATFGVAGKHTALSIAALNGHSECLKVLVEGAGQHNALSREELDAAGAIGLPPLCWAIRQRNAECIKLLVNGKCSGGNSRKVILMYVILLDDLTLDDLTTVLTLESFHFWQLISRWALMATRARLL